MPKSRNPIEKNLFRASAFLTCVALVACAAPAPTAPDMTVPRPMPTEPAKALITPTSVIKIPAPESKTNVDLTPKTLNIPDGNAEKDIFAWFTAGVSYIENLDKVTLADATKISVATNGLEFNNLVAGIPQDPILHDITTAFLKDSKKMSLTARPTAGVSSNGKYEVIDDQIFLSSLTFKINNNFMVTHPNDAEIAVELLRNYAFWIQKEGDRNANSGMANTFSYYLLAYLEKHSQKPIDFRHIPEMTEYKLDYFKNMVLTKKIQATDFLWTYIRDEEYPNLNFNYCFPPASSILVPATVEAKPKAPTPTPEIVPFSRGNQAEIEKTKLKPEQIIGGELFANNTFNTVIVPIFPIDYSQDKLEAVKQILPQRVAYLRNVFKDVSDITRFAYLNTKLTVGFNFNKTKDAFVFADSEPDKAFTATVLGKIKQVNPKTHAIIFLLFSDITYGGGNYFPYFPIATTAHPSVAAHEWGHFFLDHTYEMVYAPWELQRADLFTSTQTIQSPFAEIVNKFTCPVFQVGHCNGDPVYIRCHPYEINLMKDYVEVSESALKAGLPIINQDQAAAIRVQIQSILAAQNK